MVINRLNLPNKFYPIRLGIVSNNDMLMKRDPNVIPLNPKEPSEATPP